jgi:DNA polymerase delta subunit 1
MVGYTSNMNKRSGDGGGDDSSPKRHHPMSESFPEQDEAEEELDELNVSLVKEAPSLEEGEVGRNWCRPPLADEDLDASAQSLVFQQLECDSTQQEAHWKYHPTLRGARVPVVRMYGVNRKGNSVCAFIHGFEPYFYVEMPSGFTPDDVDAFRKTLETKLIEGARGASGASNGFPLITSVGMERKKSLWGYNPGANKPFLKVTTLLPKFVSSARTILERGINIPGVGYQQFNTFESNVLFILRFMIDCNIVGGNWLEFPKSSYTIRSKAEKVSYSQIEVDVRFDSIISHPSEGEFMDLANLRILSVDIECAGRKGHFPDADLDPVIQIASMLTVQGEAQPCVRNIMTLNTCAPIVGSEVMTFDKEADLLRAWADLMRKTDPDIIIGYNIIKFDLPYLIQRAGNLKVKEFHYLGRIKGSQVKMRDTVFSSRAYGTRESKEITIDGRVQFDLFTVIQRDHKLTSYSLNNVSAHFLGEQKEDVHHSCITDLFNGNEETRRRLAVYCLKDAYLPQRLLDKLMYMYNYVEMARVTGVPLSFLLTRGQSIKVFSQILRKAKQRGLVVPALRSGGQQDGVAFEGATVLEAKQGYYRKPVATLDFASLYPSIMMAHNLCYCTLLPHHMVSSLSPEDYTKTPSGQYFAKSQLCKGILPEILEELLGARKRAKADLKKAKNEFLKGVLNGRQLALKVSANSVYGFTGATVGKMPCLEISASVTAFGRDMIEHTKDLVHKTYCKANGYEFDSEVIYGDTDSVMIKFGTPNLAESMRLGEEAAAFVSDTFVKPIKLEFEKVYHPYLLINKKRYAGLLWTNPDKYDKMDTKGIETVRRDNCLMVRDVVSVSLQKILIEQDVEGAIRYVKKTISDLLMNKLDMSLLVVTKELSQKAENYENKVAHVELAKRMKKRDAATAPQMGDRVPYVIIQGVKGAKAYEKAEDPLYALERRLPLDSKYYIENMLTLPLTRIFTPVIGDVRKLLNGEHTRSIVKTTGSVAGGIMRFAKKAKQCLGCKSPMTGAGALCKYCQEKESEIYQKFNAAQGKLEADYNKLWTQCQRCSGSLHQDVLCTARDCPIFYRRKKTQIDLEEAQRKLKSFAW